MDCNSVDTTRPLCVTTCKLVGRTTQNSLVLRPDDRLSGGAPLSACSHNQRFLNTMLLGTSWAVSGPDSVHKPIQISVSTNPILSATHRYTLWCISNHSFSAASMRVCQPGPDARKRATTSGESRMVTRSLTGAFCGPRVASLACKEPGRELNEWALAKSSVVHSGLPFSDSR